MLRIENTSAVPVVVFTINPDGTRAETVIEANEGALVALPEGGQLIAREHTERQQPPAPELGYYQAHIIGGNE